MADILLHKCAPRKNACLPNRHAFSDDVMSQNELTINEISCLHILDLWLLHFGAIYFAHRTSILIFFVFQVGELFLEQSHNNCFKESEFIEEMDGIVKDALSQQLSLAQLDVANLLSRVFATLRK